MKTGGGVRWLPECNEGSPVSSDDHHSMGCSCQGCQGMGLIRVHDNSEITLFAFIHDLDDVTESLQIESEG